LEKLNAQLVSLIGENGAEMLISAFRSRKSISGPMLAGQIMRTYRSLFAALPDSVIFTCIVELISYNLFISDDPSIMSWSKRIGFTS